MSEERFAALEARIVEMQAELDATTADLGAAMDVIGALVGGMCGQVGVNATFADSGVVEPTHKLSVRFARAMRDGFDKTTR